MSATTTEPPASLAAGAPAPTTEEAALRIRRAVVDMAAGRQGAHVGGSLSCADVLAVLYFGVLDLPGDSFVLSKGHAAPALYAALAARGLLDEAELAGYASPGSRLFGHPSRGLPGVEFSTGSLGHGLALGCGLALAGQLREESARERVFVLMGDGELQEGSVWESLMFAGHRRLSRLTAVIDRNGLQQTAGTEGSLSLEPLGDRLRSFGWEVRETDGHDHGPLRAALAAPSESGRPVAVVARTVKGRGVPFLEGRVSSHYATLNPALHRRALAALRAAGQVAR
ncbi:transketolase [Streptomyces griseus]|uniref:transketolase n=1 Tax=Streptomyces griseus TaxID=1911 RepID=UPI00099DBDC3|nr:transketolase [Streptomyces griseus]